MRDETSSMCNDEENISLDGKENKGKGKKWQSKEESSQGWKKKHLSKIKLFHSHEVKHYAMKSQHMNVRNNPLRGVVREALD